MNEDTQLALNPTLASEKDTVEFALIGAIITYPKAIDAVAQFIRGSDFFHRDLGLVFDRVLDLHQIGKPVDDLAFLLADLFSQKLLSRDDPMRLSPAELVKAVDSAIATNAVYYAQQVSQYAVGRELSQMQGKLRYKLESGEDSQRIVSWIDAETKRISQRIAVKTQTLKHHAGKLVEQLSNAANTKVTSHRTGMFGMDDILGGLRSSELTILGARPSSGKTSLAMQIMQNIANDGKTSLFFSLEMKGRDLATRELAAAAGIEFKRISTGGLNSDDLEMLSLKSENVTHRIVVCDEPKLSAKQIRAISKVTNESSELALIAVDYLGLIKGDDARAPRNEQINDIVESMKQLAGDLSCPVMLLSQLNRSADSEKPKVSHLALSGSIEQAADVIILLHNPPTSKDGIADIMIEKQRNGSTGTVQMRFNKEATRFEEL